MTPLPESSAIDTYGGALTDYRPVTDPTTDRPAASMNKALCDVAMMTHVSVRAFVRFTGAATTGALVLQYHDAQWGSTPAVAPTLARTSAGVYTITFPATVSDELNGSHTLALRGAWANLRQFYGFARIADVSANLVTVNTYGIVSGGLIDMTGLTIDVFAL